MYYTSISYTLETDRKFKIFKHSLNLSQFALVGSQILHLSRHCHCKLIVIVEFFQNFLLNFLGIYCIVKRKLCPNDSI